MELAQIVRHGQHHDHGDKFRRNQEMYRIDRHGLKRVDFFRDLHSADSAANAEPDRPITTMAVISGPSSRVMEIATALATKFKAPNLRSS